MAAPPPQAQRPEPAFKANDPVVRVSAPDDIGIVQKATWNPIGRRWEYEVQFGGSRTRVTESQLRARISESQDAWDKLADGQSQGRSYLKSVLTYHRLRRPPARIANSFASARTEFFPHQFKPLLKFLDNPDRRILIGDDVGLGKTIEAGYILKELDAQDALNSVLVVVPARLRGKWRKELENRFDEVGFEVVGSRQLEAHALAYESGKANETFRWITSFESARNDRVLTAWDRVRPPIDLLIADEAHRMRNAKSSQHRVGRFFAENATAAVFLSATPIQNSLDDLLSLLKILSPDEFAHGATFQGLMQANEPLVMAQTLIRQRQVDWEAIRAELERFQWTRVGRELRGNRLFNDILERVRHRRPASRAELIALAADLGRMSPIGHIFTRTRKVEALPNKAQRVARWLRIEFTEQERTLYDHVASAVGVGSWAVGMAALMAYRMTASCVPAAVDYYGLAAVDAAAAPHGDPEVEDEAAETDGDAPAADAQASALTDLDWDNLLALLRDATRTDLKRGDLKVDSKLDVLVDNLRTLWREDDVAGRAPRKVVLFSYFRRTLEYLKRRLPAALGVGVEMIHGGIPPDDRETAIDRFLDEEGIRLLLTSDVGGEGIDLQKASVIVNYDLPWNPMVVEQRIGRLDRIGQESDQILVLNLVIADSVEERIIGRLMNKIRVFERSIGELDPIIGDKIDLKELARDYLSGKLSAEEVERRIEEASAAMENQINAANQLLENSDKLLTADQALIDEITALKGERQIPTAKELLDFVNAALERRHPGLQLDPVACTGTLSLPPIPELGVAIAQAEQQRGTTRSPFSTRIENQALRITFSREHAYRHRGVQLIHIRHPLVLYALDVLAEYRRATEVPVVVAAESAACGLPPGRYAFAVDAIEVFSASRSNRLLIALADVDTGTMINDSDTCLRTLFAACDSTLPTNVAAPLDADRLGWAREALEDVFLREVYDIEQRERLTEEAREEYRLARKIAIAETKLKRERERLARLKKKPDVKPSTVKGAETKLQKSEEALRSLRASAKQTVWRDAEREVIVRGVIHVS